MSDWPKKKREGDMDEESAAVGSNVTPLRRRAAPKTVEKAPKKNKHRVISPRVYLDESDPIVMNLEGLRDNNGQVRSIISHILPKDTASINRITPVERADGTIGYFEFRLELKDGSKAYRTIFKADVSNSDDPREDGAQYLAEFSALAAKELYIPTNAPALIEAQQLYDKGEVSKVAIFWCEGEKARQAVEARLAQEYAQDKFEEIGVYPVTTATLGGGSGAKSTNYALRPSPKVAGEFTAVEKNDVALKLEKYLHYIVLDNDKAGRDEGIALANKLEREYRVDKVNIYFVEPPLEAHESWDDADPLPYTQTEETRIDMFFAASPVADSWKMKSVKGGGFEVDAENVDNRLLALKRIGMTEAHVNTSTGLRHIKGPFPFENGDYPNEDERIKLIRLSLQAMGVDAKVSYMRGWEEMFSLLFTGSMRDTIYEEIMVDIEAGRANKTEDNTPEMLFIKSLGLEDTAYHREAGRLCIRDFIAATLLPAYRKPAIEPQLLFVLHGGENQGKSTFAKVLSGGALDGKSHDRFQDQVQLHDLYGSPSHGFLQLKQKLAGVTVAEFADQDLGDNVRSGLAGALKRFANMGQVGFRNMYADGDQSFNLRCIRIFTTNKQDILTDDMGFRRFIILDVAKTQLPSKRSVEELLARENREPTEYEAMILRGHNPNLNWLVENRAAMLAHMYDSDEWRGTLSVSASMQELMRNMQTPYKAQQNWEIKLLSELQQFLGTPRLGIASHNLVDWATDYRGEGRPTRRKWSAFMTSLGFRCDNKSVNNQAVRHYYINADRASEIDQYLNWVPAISGDHGRWILSDSPNPDKIELMSKSLNATSVPF
jgi:hypothetical protein